MRTAASGTYISKAVSSNFPNQAPRVSSFIANVNFELAELIDLLLTIASGTLRYDVACQWVRDNKPRWQEWLPIETNCITGLGLADAAGSFVNDRANATTCEVCTPGRFSQEYLDNSTNPPLCPLCSGDFSGKERNDQLHAMPTWELHGHPWQGDLQCVRSGIVPNLGGPDRLHQLRRGPHDPATRCEQKGRLRVQTRLDRSVGGGLCELRRRLVLPCGKHSGATQKQQQ